MILWPCSAPIKPPAKAAILSVSVPIELTASSIPFTGCEEYLQAKYIPAITVEIPDPFVSFL